MSAAGGGVTPGRLLIVAGSDSGGGAGIQADIKAATALGAYAMTAIAALTAQNTRGVFGVVGVDPAFVALQMKLVLEDIGADAVKIGMLGSAEVIETVAATYQELCPGVPLVVDPVMVAKGGHSLLAADAENALRVRLLPLAEVVTPNIPEAEALTGMKINDFADMRRAAEILLGFGPKAVLLKGGHMDGPILRDLLLWRDGERIYEGPRIETAHTHGTGCTLASATASGIACGMNLPDAAARARAYVLEAIRTAPGLGHGHGPLNHMHTVGVFDAK